MNKKIIHTLYYLLIIPYSFLVDCSGGNENRQQLLSKDSLKEHMINVNKIMVDNEASQIADFIKRHQWKMDSTGTGLRYWIYSKGSGPVPKLKDKVKISYKLFLLDAAKMYESEKDKYQVFTLGQGESTAGLQEALMLMPGGSKAWIIVPKNLGYGMTGDGNKIPGNATLLYEVELQEVIKNN